MRNFFTVFLIFLLVQPACKKRSYSAHTASHKLKVHQTVAVYAKCKDSVAVIRKKIKPGWKDRSSLIKEKIFTNAVTQIIIPPWMGTAWDFNGISEEPGKGSIACGYFVTTVLRDAGVRLNRVKLAQCASSEMIQSLVNRQQIRSFYGNSFERFYQHLQAGKFGLYIVGLDNHTGFIYNDGEDIWFIHSSYIGPMSVQKELASESILLKSSKCHVLGKISADKGLLDLWP